MEGLTGGYGFTGIVAALLGKPARWGLIPTSVLFGGLLVGANTMQRAVQIPAALINAILRLVVLFVSGSAPCGSISHQEAQDCRRNYRVIRGY